MNSMTDHMTVKFVQLYGDAQRVRTDNSTPPTYKVMPLVPLSFRLGSIEGPESRLTVLVNSGMR